MTISVFTTLILLFVLYLFINLMFRNFHQEIKDLDEDMHWNIASFLLFSEVIIDTSLAGFAMWIMYISLKL